MSKVQHIAWLALFALLATSLQAQHTFGYADGHPDARTLAAQRKVEELFQRGEFDRAYFIYRHELVPVGDKYAQYMVGYMHLTGIGLDEDPVAAYAWYRLAAERGTPEFVAVCDQLMHDLQADEQRHADAYYLQLRREYSDLVILLASIKRDLRDLRLMTGSRLGSDAVAISVIEFRNASRGLSSSEFYPRIRRHLEQSLKTLSELGGFPDLETDPDRVDIDEVERLVNERIESPQGQSN